MINRRNQKLPPFKCLFKRRVEMTFCLGMKVQDGLIGIADTRITSGAERITGKKVTVHQHGKHSIFVMTSGLRSARDKALTYFDEVFQDSEDFSQLYKAVNAFADQIRRVSREDKPALEEAGFRFNLHALVGGQLEGDKEHKLYMIYPEGNWVEVGESTPFYIIGESGYGKPILERTLEHSSDLGFAMKVGFLAFNATITCAVDVDYPIDVVAYRRDTYRIIEERFTRDEISDLSRKWQSLIREAVPKLPGEWMNKILDKLPSPERSPMASSQGQTSGLVVPSPERSPIPGSINPGRREPSVPDTRSSVASSQGQTSGLVVPNPERSPIPGSINPGRREPSVPDTRSSVASSQGQTSGLVVPNPERIVERNKVSV